MNRILALCLLIGVVQSQAAEDQTGSNLGQIVAAAAAYESGQSQEPLRRLEEAVGKSVANPVARRELEAALIQVLGANSTFEGKKFACKQLGIIGSQSALPALAKLAADPETTGIACLALTTYPSGKADEILRNQLHVLTGSAQIQLINTLGDRLDAKAIAALAELASRPSTKGGGNSDSARPVSEAAIAALGKIGTPSAWKALQAVRSRHGGELTGALVEATLRCADNFRSAGNTKAARAIYEELLQKADSIGARRSALATLLRTDSDHGEARIKEVLEGNDEALKPVAIAAIASVDSPGASETFGIQMHHLRPELQALMVDVLAARGDDAARLELAKALSLPEPIVRRAAVVALGRMGDPYFLGLLAQSAASATESEDARAVEAALVALKGGAETDRQLAAQLKLSVPKVRVVLIATIAQRQGAAANDIFLEETDNSDPVVAKAAFRALAKVGTDKQAAPVVGKLLTLRDAGVRADAESTAAQLLRKMPDAAKRSAVVCEALGRATTPEQRNALITLLPACGNEAALKELKAAVADSDSEVRYAAVRTLADWPNDSAWDELVRIYGQPQPENLRALALPGLVRLLEDQNAQPDEALIGRYKQVFAHARSAADLKLLLGALSSAADPEALAVAQPLLSNAEVRPEAALAVKKIAESIKAKNPQAAEEALKKLQPNP